MYHISSLPYAEINKYSRQIIVPGVGLEGQKKLRDAKILVVGCGGLGCPLLMYLGSCGISTIGIVDHDIVEAHNLQRQIVYKESDIGAHKVDAMCKFLNAMNSLLRVQKYKMKLGKSMCSDIIRNYDIIVDCTDSIETRYLLSDFAKIQQKDFICASVIRWEGHLYVFKRHGPCYRCLYPNMKELVTSCDENGIIGPICGIFGSFLGLEIIKCILGLSGTKMILYNGMSGQHSNIKLRPTNKDCKVCNGSQTVFEYTRPKSHVKPSLNMIHEITWPEMLNGNYTLIDVRKSMQYDMFRIKHSISIPIDSLKDQIRSLKQYKRLAVVCNRGITSIRACEILKNHDIQAVSVFGGIEEYKNTYILGTDSPTEQ